MSSHIFCYHSICYLHLVSCALLGFLTIIIKAGYKITILNTWKCNLKSVWVETLLSCRNEQNCSSAFNPSGFAPVEHTNAHAQGHTLIETDAIFTGAVVSHSQCPGSRCWGGYVTLLKGTSAVARRWTAAPPAVSSPIFEQWEWELNLQVIERPTLTTEPRLLFSC